MPRVRVLNRRTMYRGRVFELVKETFVVGGHIVVRETIRHPGAVVIVPLLSRSQVVFVRQYRRAVDRVLLELPAGTLSPGELPLACARRELQEETGWRARRFVRLGTFFAAPGFTSERMTVFLATGLRHVGANPEPDELLTPTALTFQEALRKVWSGAICDGKSIVGLLLARHHLTLAGWSKLV